MMNGSQAMRTTTTGFAGRVVHAVARAAMRRSVRHAIAVVASCGSMVAAHAGLGEPVASVARDGVSMRAASMKSTALPMYDRHDITTADGANVREFAARDGTVFAVNFDGPVLPDLKSVLGAHYETYVTAARAHRGSHHVLSFESDGVVVTIVQQQRGFVGSAHVPASVPSGVTLQELQP